MGRKYKYCSICRCPDDLIYCTKCRKAYHLACIRQQTKSEKFTSSTNESTQSSAEMNILKFVCEDCTDQLRKGTPEPPEKRMKLANNVIEDNPKLKILQSLLPKILYHRQNFLRDHIKKLLFLQMNETGEEWEKSSLGVKVAGMTPVGKKRGVGRPPKAKNLTECSEQQSFLDSTDLSISETPSYLTGVTLRDFQVEGVNALCTWFKRGVGGIVADESGLGKTLQVIAMIAVLKHVLHITGPHLVIVPASGIQHWANELRLYAPSLTFIKIQGGISERQSVLRRCDVATANIDIYIATYEVYSAEQSFFKGKWQWATLTIDEGHRVLRCNPDAQKFFENINTLQSHCRLLLTGFPLKNKAYQLGKMLQYILPDVLPQEGLIADYKDEVMSQPCVEIRSLLESTMLISRKKINIEKSIFPKRYCKIRVQMTMCQRKLYKKFLSGEDFGHSDMSKIGPKELGTIMLKLYKVINHPKLLREKLRPASTESPVDETTDPTDKVLRSLYGESLIASCGKLAVLDRLLLRLKSQGSKVLLFTQWTDTLDILEEYITFRFGLRYQAYLRLDGNVNRIHRELDIHAFNHPSSEIFIYLISTKYGCESVGLSSADSVILYDVSWDPLLNLQAENCAHRISQEKHVVVYKLITSGTIEERISDISEKKLLIDHYIFSKPVDDKHLLKSDELISTVDVNESMSTSNEMDTPSRNERPRRSRRNKLLPKAASNMDIETVDANMTNVNVLFSSFWSRFDTVVTGFEQQASAMRLSVLEVWKLLRFGCDDLFTDIKEESTDADVTSDESISIKEENVSKAFSGLSNIQLDEILDSALDTCTSQCYLNDLVNIQQNGCDNIGEEDYVDGLGFARESIIVPLLLHEFCQNIDVTADTLPVKTIFDLYQASMDALSESATPKSISKRGRRTPRKAVETTEVNGTSVMYNQHSNNASVVLEMVSISTDEDNDNLEINEDIPKNTCDQVIKVESGAEIDVAESKDDESVHQDHHPGNIV